MSSGCHLCALSLSTLTTLSGSHVIAGAAAAMSSLGSALAIAMMVGGGGAPPLAAWLGTDWIRAPGRARHRLVRLGATFHAERTAA